MRNKDIRYKIVFGIVVFSALTIASVPANAHTDTCDVKIERPLISTFTMEMGSASILDTYLTPIRYHGFNMRLGYEGMRSMGFSPEKWVMQGGGAVEYAKAHNHAKNHTIHSLMIDGKWGMMHRWNNVLTDGLTIMAGGSTQLRGGVLYCAHNSNNPVSAKIRWSMNLTGMAVYNMRCGKLPITLRYQATLPTIGAFFSLDYGEAFYELYLGNKKGIVNVGWWGNRFDVENLVTADLHLGKSVLRIGYRNLVETSFVHNLNTQIFTHGFVIGISGEWLQLNPKKPLSPQAKVVSAMY